MKPKTVMESNRRRQKKQSKAKTKNDMIKPKNKWNSTDLTILNYEFSRKPFSNKNLQSKGNKRYAIVVYLRL